MAFVDDENDKLQNIGQPTSSSQPSDGGLINPQTQGSASSGQSAFAGSASGPDVNPQGAAGTGGQNHWTNIQDYLNANQGQSKISDQVGSYLNNIVGNEANSLNQSSSQAKTSADNELGKVDYSQDQASKLLSDATAAGQGSDPYNQNVNQLKGALSAQYAGPTSYAYGYSNDYSNAKSDLQNNPQTLVDNVYGQTSAANGGPSSLSAGQLDLQHQLDQPYGDRVNSVEQQALYNMGNFETGAQQTIGNTSNAITNDQAQFANDQQGLSSYLNNQAGTDQTNLQNLVGQWNTDEAAIKNSMPTSPETHWYDWGNLATGQSPGWQGIDKNQFYSYAPGGTATVGNVIGGDDYRNQFNTLADVLGQSAIQPDTAALHGSVNFNNDGFQNAIADMAAREEAQGLSLQTGNGAWSDAQKQAYANNGVWIDKGAYNDGLNGSGPAPIGTITSRGSF